MPTSASATNGEETAEAHEERAKGKPTSKASAPAAMTTPSLKEELEGGAGGAPSGTVGESSE
eukprot:8209933-Alexandrium_andersonii.AAC.1